MSLAQANMSAISAAHDIDCVFILGRAAISEIARRSALRCGSVITLAGMKSQFLWVKQLEPQGVKAGSSFLGLE